MIDLTVLQHEKKIRELEEKLSNIQLTLEPFAEKLLEKVKSMDFGSLLQAIVTTVLGANAELVKRIEDLEDTALCSVGTYESLNGHNVKLDERLKEMARLFHQYKESKADKEDLMKVLERLEISPGGCDKIDELSQSFREQFARIEDRLERLAGRDRLQREE